MATWDNIKIVYRCFSCLSLNTYKRRCGIKWSLDFFRELLVRQEAKVKNSTCCLLLLSLLCAHLVYAEGFKMVKVGDHFEPELRELVTTLPQTNIQTGIYQYALDDGPGPGKIGFLKGEEFNYVEMSKYEASGDAIYAIFSPYFLLDVSMGGTSRNGLLFLFKFDESGVNIIDVIGTGYINKLSAEIMFDSNQNRPILKYPALGKIENINHDGIPKIKVEISTSFHFAPSFLLYFDITEDKLRLNLTPSLYKSLFKLEEKIVTSTRKKSDAFYIYGFLAKDFDLNTIETELRNDTNRRWIIEILNGIDTWDTAFHDQGKFSIKQFHLGRNDK